MIASAIKSSVRSSEGFEVNSTGCAHGLLWGKAQPSGDGPAWHPLVCHMLDVSAVASELLDMLPRSTATRLLGRLGLPEPEARRWLALLVALHDLGKATPAFQWKHEPARDRLRQSGFDLHVAPNAAHHGVAGVQLVEELLARLGTKPDDARFLARATCAHHGQFPADLEVQNVGPRQRGSKSPWQFAREQLAHDLILVLRIGDEPPRLRERDWATIGLLAGFIAVADWVGSMQEHFPYVTLPTDLEEYHSSAQLQARKALASVGFQVPVPVHAASFAELFNGCSPWPLR